MSAASGDEAMYNNNADKELEETAKEHNWTQIFNDPRYQRSCADMMMEEALDTLHQPMEERKAAILANTNAAASPSDPQHALYKSVHTWAEKQHVVTLAFKVRHGQVPAEWLKSPGKVVKRIEERLKRIVWGRICEWQKPELNQVRCTFCINHDLRCYKITLPNPLGQATILGTDCTACRSRAKRDCQAGIEDVTEPRYLGEGNWFAALKSDRNVAARMESNHFGHSDEYGATREEVRQRDCQPLTEEDQQEIMQLQLECTLSGDTKLRSSHFRLWDALFPLHVVKDVWPRVPPSERAEHDSPTYSYRQSS